MFGKHKVVTKAVIIADEGYKYAENSAKVALQHETYIVEVHPEGEAAFRTEVKAWVSWPNMPKEGDEVQVLHEPGTQKVELDIKGDPRFDWKLQAAQSEQHAADRREQLLQMPPDADDPPRSHHLP